MNFGINLFFFRNCQLSASGVLKLSDCAALQPAFANDYAQQQLSAVPLAGTPAAEERLPMRWIPWEVHAMVRRRRLTEIKND